MRVSVEYAHANIAAVDVAGMQKSVMVAQRVVEHLCSIGHEASTAILLDDKKVEAARVAKETENFLDLIAALGMPPDDAISESQLSQWLPDLVALLPHARQRKIRRLADNYIKKYNNLPCSLDIAIWHTLRLGLLGERPLGHADLVVSILDSGNREFEELADSQFLSRLQPAVAPRIVRLYYPESPANSTSTAILLEDLQSAMKGLRAWQPS